MTIGTRIKELRTRRRESLQDVADSIQASKTHIWDLERGASRNPSLELVTKLARHFGVSIAYLVGEEPTSESEAEVMAMFRDLKDMTPEDRALMRDLMERFRSRGSSV